MKPTDEQAFLKTIDQNKGILYKISNAYGRDVADKEDIIQEITIQLWRAYPKYNADFKFSTWMYRIGLNVAISWHRKAQTRSSTISPISDSVSETAHEYTTDMKEDIDLLYGFIAKLKELDRALMLLYLDEKSNTEIAEILGISASNVSTKVGRIKEQLKKEFETIKHTI